MLNEKGVHPNPEKTRVTKQMNPPRNVSEVRRFLGIVNQLGKFSHRLVDLSQLLWELLRRTLGFWVNSRTLRSPTLKEKYPKVLCYYVSTISRLKQKLIQKFDHTAWEQSFTRYTPTSDGRPVTFASHSLANTEIRYAQIEKEAFAIIWACERFVSYILGKPFLIYTNHKLLIPLLDSDHLDSLPPRILRFRLLLTRFRYSIEHTPGKTLYIPETLSQAPVPMTEHCKKCNATQAPRCSVI